MKIAVVCYEYPPIGGGGGRAARDVARALARRGHEIRVFTAINGFRSGKAHEEGVLVRRYFAFRKRADRCTVPEMGGYLIGAFLPALAEIRKWQPDVIHAHFAVPSGVLAFILSKLCGVPYVITAQLGDVPGAMGPRTDSMFRILHPFIAPIWANAAACSACSSFTAQLAQKAYGRTVNVIFNGIDLPSAHLQIGDANPKRKFIYAGRFDPQKNLTLMIEGFGRLANRDDWTLEMVGDGPDRPRITEAIRAHSLDKRVVLHGWITPEEARKKIEGAEVFVMTSRQEGLPLVTLEALRCGLALVGSRIGGLADVLLDKKNGIAFGEGNATELADALGRMINDQAFLASARNESLELAKTFEIGRIAVSYESWIRDALNSVRKSKPRGR